MNPCRRLTVLAFALCSLPSHPSLAGQTSYAISCNDGFLAKYGLRYPITYRFRVGTHPRSVTIKYSYSGETWSDLQPRKVESSESGINAYVISGTDLLVSVPFSDESNVIRLTFDIVPDTAVEFVAACQKYECRKTAFTVSADDWCYATNEYFKPTVDWFRARGEPLAAAVISNWEGIEAPWADIRNRLGPYLEIAAHSENHYTFCGSLPPNPVEVSNSRIRILQEVPMPGAVLGQQMPTWIEPCGYTNDALRAAIASSGFLVDRSTEVNFSGIQGWSDDGLFRRLAVTTPVPSDYDVEALNAKFTKVLLDEDGDIYHIYFHPWDTQAVDAIQEHVEFVSNYSGVWHATVGEIYTYVLAANAINLGSVGFRESQGWFSPMMHQRVWPVRYTLSEAPMEFVGIVPSDNSDLRDGTAAGVRPLGTGTFDNIASLVGSGFPTAQGWFNTDHCRRVWPVDIDGDGDQDIVGIQNSGNVFVMTATGSANGVVRYESWHPTPGWGFPESQGWLTAAVTQRLWPARVNGDSAEDIVGIANDGRVMVMLALGDGSYETFHQTNGWGFPTIEGWFSTQYRERVWPADVDNDGRTEIVGIGFAGNIRVMDDDGIDAYETWEAAGGFGFPADQGWFSTLYTQRVWPADVDGDGYDDIVGISFDGQAAVLFNARNGGFGTFARVAGNGFPSDTAEKWFSTNYGQRVFPADVDGDSDDDIVGFTKSGAMLVMYANGREYSDAMLSTPITVQRIAP